MPCSHFRYLSDQSCWNYTHTHRFKAATSTFYPQVHSWQIHPILLIKHYKTALLPITWRKVSAIRRLVCIQALPQKLLTERFQAHHSAQIQLLKYYGCQRPEEPPLHQPLKWEWGFWAQQNLKGTSNHTGNTTYSMQNQKHCFSSRQHELTDPPGRSEFTQTTLPHSATPRLALHLAAH